MNEIKNNSINSINNSNSNGISIGTTGTTGITGITINDSVSVNVEDAGTLQDDLKQQKSQKPQNSESSEACGINHDEDVLIDNEVTFLGLLDYLRGCPEALRAEREEAKRKEEEQELKKIFGENYSEYVTVEESVTVKNELKKMERRPGASQLWNNFHRVAVKKIESGGRVDVYENGYAVYDNGNRRTVVWVPDCGSKTYYFAPLREADKGRIKQKDTVGEDVLGSIPWYHAIVIAGEDSIEWNIDHPKSTGTVSEYDDVIEYGLANHACQMCSHIETPEEAFWRREAEREKMEVMTEKQWEVYNLYYIEGYTQREIANKLGITQKAVDCRLDGAEKKLKNLHCHTS